MNSVCYKNNIDLIWGRVFFAYGPGQRLTSLIPTCYNNLKNGVKLEIHNPNILNDFIYISDVANAIKHLIEIDNVSGIFNIGSGQGRAVWEVVNIVASALSLSPIYKDMPLSHLGNWANINSISKHGWKSLISLEAGILRTINAFETT
jgi:nucleoside-diphosphate-sugar epimerase